MTHRLHNFTFVAGLPRSGTAWTANLLSNGLSSLFLHEEIGHHASVTAFARRMETLSTRYPYVGCAETALPFVGYDRIARHFPNAKWVLIEREPEDVRKSITKAGLSSNLFDHCIERWDEFRSEVYHKAFTPPITIPFASLFDMGTLSVLWGYVFHGRVLPLERVAQLVKLNVQINDLDQINRNVAPTLTQLLKSKD